MRTVSHATNGFTLVELLIALSILAIIAGIGLPTYSNYRDRANNSQAKVDIQKIAAVIQRYFAKNGSFPENLSNVHMDHLKDPWESNYQYLNIETADKTKPRKDRSLKPFNSDYDLYSKGKDRLSKKPITASASHDDIIRANNGGFVGLAKDY